MTRHIQLSCLLALAAASGCGETTSNPLSQLTFDRPVDIAFACYGNLRITNGGPADPSQPVVISAMPTAACDIRSQPQVPLPPVCQDRPTQEAPFPTPKLEQPTPAGQETLRDLSLIDPVPDPPAALSRCTELPEGKVSPVSWYGLILQSGPGTVAIAQFATKPGGAFSSAGDDVVVLDADPLTPGKNSISVGEDPVAIHTDSAGCHAITANAGSCDLSVLDLNSALDLDRAVQVERLEVKNASGTPIRARPAAMVGEPSGQDIGNMCPAKPRGLAYIAYPSCHLVAAVDTATGTIVSGIQYDAAGTATIVGGDVTCPDECGGGGAVTPGVRPVTLDLEVDLITATRRLAIGADNAASITMVELDQDWRPSLVSQVALEDSTGNLGVTAVALSPEIGMGGDGTMIDDQGPGGTFQFAYAVATDGTVRVADVLNVRRECDTQVDARFAREIRIVSELSCLEAGTLMTPRRAGASSPGIHLPGDAIPLSVELFRSADPAGEGRAKGEPTTLLGHFAAVTASNGSVFIVNVDDDAFADVHNPNAPLEAPVQLAMAHQLRDASRNRGRVIDLDDKDMTGYKPCDYPGGIDPAGDAIGGPRAAAVPARTVPAGTVAAEKLTSLPGFRQLRCERKRDDDSVHSVRAISELMYAAPADVREQAFPDLMALPKAETWSMVWEGSLSLNSGTSDVDGPQIREGMLTSSSQGLHVLDATRSFCDAGVEPYDILQLRGCDPSLGPADCPQGYTCFVHPQSQLQNFGTCMRADEADRLANACRDFLTTFRRYTVKTTHSGELVAAARRHELRTTPLDGCLSDQQCEELSNVAASHTSAKHPCGDQVCEPARGESVATCPADCKEGGKICGDQICEGQNSDKPGSPESAANCPSDCANLTWACVADPERAPKGGTGKRCQLRCDPAVPSDCVAGTVCKGGASGSKSGFCMEGVVPPQACINATQRYELRAGEAFAVIGGVTGFVHPIIEDANGQCVRDPDASRLSIGRLPLVPKDRAAPNTLHMCDPAADPITGQLPNGTFEPNPCLTTVPHIDVKPLYNENPQPDEEPCQLTPEKSKLDERQAPAVRFRNQQFGFTLVDPHYPGDAVCITDREANLGQIPHVVPGLTLAFRQFGGSNPLRMFTGLGADNQPSFPVRVVRGPTDSLWVLDEGDFLSSSGTQASTRGKVLRFHPAALGGVNVLK
ncbi:MAG TPA: hypothetical protein VK932_28855 [Kofleriaceae bacterium]|nr:hypothetical protein [Kofleriaceae bacterium]